ncbi:MAG TPA: biotin--[acetyl-CoA-carboxylase] ligase [Gemmatimonadaceae bacterium]
MTLYDGLDAAALAGRLALPRVEVFDEIGSTLDEAHRLAAQGTPAGTMVLADAQTAGRGRQGRQWRSASGAGVWVTLVERPGDGSGLGVLSLRCGLYAAEALDSLAGARVAVKWPNDLYAGDGKLAGILVETRWRASAPDWVAIGFGLNVIAPDLETAAGLAPGASRLAALDAVIPALRRAVAAHGELTAAELGRWAERDIASGRIVTSPAHGRAVGITAAGELLIESGDGRIAPHRSGSLLFAEPLACS